MTVLTQHYRGDTFRRTFTLGGGWVGADFTGGVIFTLRTRQPLSTITDDLDAGVVDQASVAGGEITFASGVATVIIPATRTTDWPFGRLFFDVQGKVSGSPATVYTLDAGTIVIVADITRTP